MNGNYWKTLITLVITLYSDYWTHVDCSEEQKCDGKERIPQVYLRNRQKHSTESHEVV